MKKNIITKVVRFKLRDFENQQALDDYLNRQLGDMCVFVWHAFNCWALVNSIYFESICVGDERYHFMIRKNHYDDTITVAKDTLKEKSEIWSMY